MCKLDAVILASGLSRRMGQNKLSLVIDERQNITLLEATLSKFPFSEFEQVIVVVSDEKIEQSVKKYPVQIVFNQVPELGKSYAIRCGVRRSSAEDGTLFMVADQPLVKKRTIKKLVRCFCLETNKIVYPKVNGHICNPVIFPVKHRDALGSLTGDQGGKVIVRENMESAVAVESNDPHEFLDADTMDEFQQIKQLYPDYK